MLSHPPPVLSEHQLSFWNIGTGRRIGSGRLQRHCEDYGVSHSVKIYGKFQFLYSHSDHTIHFREPGGYTLQGEYLHSTTKVICTLNSILKLNYRALDNCSLLCNESRHVTEYSYVVVAASENFQNNL